LKTVVNSTIIMHQNQHVKSAPPGRRGKGLAKSSFSHTLTSPQYGGVRRRSCSRWKNGPKFGVYTKLKA
jgi:hypothetical protein